MPAKYRKKTLVIYVRKTLLFCNVVCFSCDTVAAFVLFICERQKIWVNRNRNRPNLTQNKVLANKWFTNMYRELDRGTMYFRKCINETEPTDGKTDVINVDRVSRVLFKSIVYRYLCCKIINRSSVRLERLNRFSCLRCRWAPLGPRISPGWKHPVFRMDGLEFTKNRKNVFEK